MKKTRFAKEYEWLRPYYSLACSVVPEAKRITHVRLTVPRHEQITRQCGALTYKEETRTYTMTLYKTYRRVKQLTAQRKRGHYTATCEIKTMSKLDILDTFAHEIAHAKHWDHTPQRKMLECKLSMLFMAKLLEGGYVSEEKELELRKKDREC